MRVVKLEEIIQAAVKMLDLEYVGCEMQKEAGDQVLRVYIDAEGGINLDDCERASRQISALLDVEDPFAGHYNLEVTSPGMDRPLFTKEHFERFVGSKAKIRLKIPNNGRRNYTGVIDKVVGDNVIVIVDGAGNELSISNIEKANLVPEF